MNRQIPKTRFLLIAFMLLLQANGSNISSNSTIRSSQVLPKVPTTVPDLITDSMLSPKLNQEVKLTTFAKKMAQVNKTVAQ